MKLKDIKNRAVIIMGPQGCGKTTNADALCEFFGLYTVVDNFDCSLKPDGEARRHILDPGGLHLTNNPELHLADLTGDGTFHVTVLSYDLAMKMMEGVVT